MPVNRDELAVELRERSGRLGPTERELRMEAVLREIEFGNPAHDDCCPLCGNVRKRGHLDWGRIAKALEE